MALSNTIGAMRGKTFEPQTGLDPPEAIGVLSSSPQAHPKLVYSGGAVGSDLSTIPLWDWFIWVWAHSVFSKTPVLRQAKTSELKAIWDYEGKLESRGWSREQSLRILSARLLSPPGKMLRRFSQSVSNAILLKLDEESWGGSRGFIGNILFSPLEVNATTCVAAAQANDAEVDLSAWSSPSETEEEAHVKSHTEAICGLLVGVQPS